MISHQAPLNSNFGKQFLRGVGDYQRAHSSILELDKSPQDLDPARGRVKAIRNGEVMEATRNSLSMRDGKYSFSFSSDHIEVSRSDLFDCTIKADLKSGTVDFEMKDSKGVVGSPKTATTVLTPDQHAERLKATNAMINRRLNNRQTFFYRENDRWFGNDRNKSPEVLDYRTGGPDNGYRKRITLANGKLTGVTDKQRGACKTERVEGSVPSPKNGDQAYDWKISRDFSDSIIRESWDKESQEYRIEFEPTNLQEFAERVATKPRPYINHPSTHGISNVDRHPLTEYFFSGYTPQR